MNAQEQLQADVDRALLQASYANDLTVRQIFLTIAERKVQELKRVKVGRGSENGRGMVVRP